MGTSLELIQGRSLVGLNSREVFWGRISFRGDTAARIKSSVINYANMVCSFGTQIFSMALYLPSVRTNPFPACCYKLLWQKDTAHRVGDWAGSSLNAMWMALALLWKSHFRRVLSHLASNRYCIQAWGLRPLCSSRGTLYGEAEAPSEGDSSRVPQASILGRDESLSGGIAFSPLSIKGA